MLTDVATVVFVVLMAFLAIFQVALASGAPWGRFAFGGQHEGALPARLRVTSAVTVIVYAAMTLVVLDNAGATDVLSEGLQSVAIWVLVGLLALNIIPNAISRSRYERFTMTPVLVVLTLAALTVALQP